MKDSQGISIAKLKGQIERLKEKNEYLKAQLNIKVGPDIMRYINAMELSLALTYKVMAACPPCSLHGNRCAPHAVEWIEGMKTGAKRLRKACTNVLPLLKRGHDDKHCSCSLCKRTRQFRAALAFTGDGDD